MMRDELSAGFRPLPQTPPEGLSVFSDSPSVARPERSITSGRPSMGGALRVWKDPLRSRQGAIVPDALPLLPSLRSKDEYECLPATNSLGAAPTGWASAAQRVGSRSGLGRLASLRCSERRCMPSSRAAAEMLPSVSCSACWMCSHCSRLSGVITPGTDSSSS